MPATSASFTHSKIYDPLNRPMADVVLIGPGGVRGSLYQCLVDTGADYTVLPLAMALSAGITVSGGFSTITTVAGAASFYFLTGITLEVEGYVVPTDVYIDPSPAAAYIPLLGRATLLSAFDLGFNVSDWLYD